MNDNQIKLKWKNMLFPVMAALLTYSIITNANQANEIDLLNNRINNLTSELNIVRNNVSSIYNNVDEQLKKQASSLSSVDFTLGELDTDTHTIDVTLKVVPKTVTEHMAVSVKIGDEAAEFRRNGNEFTASIPVNMFMEYGDYPMLYIESDTGVQTEVLEDVNVSYLYSRYLPKVYANIGHNTDFTKGKLELDSHLRIDAKPTGYGSDITFVKYELVTEVNGTEVERGDITSQVKNGVYDGKIQKTIDAGAGDFVAIYLYAEDSLGYIHKTTAIYWHEDKNGAEAEAPKNPVESIYDKDGNLLNER